MTSRYLWRSLLKIAGTAIALVIGLYFFLDFYTHHGEVVQIPDVKGLKSTVAVHKLEAAGLHVQITDTGYVRTIAPDVILDQSIEPGVEVKQGRLITLTINSDKAKTLALPNVVDGSLREAQIKLKSMGFKLGDVKRVKGDLDLVVRLEVQGNIVQPGMRVSVELPINIVAGDGDVDEYYNGNDSAAWEVERQREWERMRQEEEHYLETED